MLEDEGMMKSILVTLLLIASAPAIARDIVVVPVTDAPPKGLAAIQNYAAAPGWSVTTEAEQLGDQSALVAVELEMPSPFQGGRLLSDSVLPVLPHGTIYRFKYLDVEHSETLDVPFQYVEVDWNTEGLPRGPDGSFINPHFDFHFYTKSQAFVEQEMQCVTVGKTCDGLKTGYEQMRRFLNLPPSSYMPPDYFPDSGSAIAQMGLHNLNGQFQYSIEHVNHNPVIIYGSFDGEIVFLEASLTLFAFQDAMMAAASKGQLQWAVPQPVEYAYAWWPKAMTLNYDAEREVFTFVLTDFEKHQSVPLD